MSLNTKSATAIVRLTGLGILCFNPRQKRAEKLFIHEEGHNLTVEVFKPVSAADNDEFNETGDKEGLMDYAKFSGYWYCRLGNHENFVQSQLTSTFDRVGLSIDICGIGAPEIDGYRKYEPDSFSREDTGEDVDMKDFRWIINVERDGIFGDRSLTPVANRNTGSTKVFISNAEFYTASIAREEEQGDMIFKKVPLMDPAATNEEKLEALEGAEDFGKIGADIGAAINADHVQMKIKVGDEEMVYLLPRIHRPYVIYLKNNAFLATSDIPVYKKYWETTGDAFDLLTVDEIAARISDAGDPVGARTMCNGVVVDEPETIEPFIGGGEGGGDGISDS